jgi:erythromycin esterase-like protein
MKIIVTMMAALLVLGCASTRGAYNEAQSLDEYAYVVAEHYAVLVNEAADLATQPGQSEQVKDALKAADAKAKPLVLQLRLMATNYAAIKSADNERALQAALNQTVLAVAEFIRTLRAARVSPSGALMPEFSGGVA